MQKIPAFVINLDRRTDRWNSIVGELTKVGIVATRVSAIDGRNIASDDVPNLFISRGYYANILSHYKALKCFLNTDHPAALILEDDSQLSFDIPVVLESVNWWPPGVKIINMDTFYRGLTEPFLFLSESGRTPSGRKLYPIARYCYGAASYLINREGAKRVIRDGSRKIPSMPMDTVLFDLRWSRTARYLKPVQVIPSMARQKSEQLSSDLGSDSTWNSMPSKDPKFFSRLLRRILHRYILGLPYKIKLSFLRHFGLVYKKKLVWNEYPPN